MRIAEHIVLTGATGFIGRHLAVRMLLEQPHLRLTLLVRGRSRDEARARALTSLGEAARSANLPLDARHAFDSIEVSICDVTEPSCAVDASDLGPKRAFERVTFWHAAASLRFEDNRSLEIHEHNVDGTRHALQLARAIGATRFVYVSTAYVGGATSGIIPEAVLSQDRCFNNAYEHSKCVAEHLVAQRCRELSIDYQIVRPSIVIGDSGTHATVGSDTGLYGFVREMLRIRRALEAAEAPVRLVADVDAPLNFVPVDLAVEAMLELQGLGFPGGPVHHVTSRGCPSVGATLDAICDELHVPRFELVPRLEGNVSALEGLLSRRTGFYASYLCGARSFARAQGTPIDVEPAQIARYVRSYLAERRAEADTLDARPLTARDGFPLLTASRVRPQRQFVVLVNALGMPRLALEKVETVLADRFNVLTWESRGVPSLSGALDGERACFARHADDLEDLLALHGVERAHLVGWCTGADVALDFARRAPERVLSLTCLHGPFVAVSALRTPYQADLERIVRRAAQSEAQAELFQRLIGQLLAMPSDISSQCLDGQECLRGAVSVLDPELLHVTGAPLRSVQSLFRYCLLLRHYFDEAPSSAPSVPLPALVVSAEDDAIAHVGASREVAARLGAELRVAATGGHFAPCKDDTLVAAVAAFLARCAAEATRAARPRVVNAWGDLSTASGRYLPSAPAA